MDPEEEAAYGRLTAGRQGLIQETLHVCVISRQQDVFKLIYSTHTLK